MAARRWRAPLARFGAPVAFLAAVTIAVLLVRAGLESGDASRAPSPRTATSIAEPLRIPTKAYYRIRPGDTLGAVADRFHTTLRGLLALNPQVEPNALRIGQRLRVR